MVTGGIGDLATMAQCPTNSKFSIPFGLLLKVKASKE